MMLAVTERLACDAGLDWAFCDTDSMALAKPSSMQVEDFYATAEKIAAWFTPLNPYADRAPLLKIEDYNYGGDGKTYEPLYCHAISSKRYALYNLDRSGNALAKKLQVDTSNLVKTLSGSRCISGELTNNLTALMKESYGKR